MISLRAYILHALQKLMHDENISFLYLIRSVPIGFDEAISPSTCFPSFDPSSIDEAFVLSIHFSNWSSAEDQPKDVQPLIDEEVKQGRVIQFEGT